MFSGKDILIIDTFSQDLRFFCQGVVIVCFKNSKNNYPIVYNLFNFAAFHVKKKKDLKN